MTTQRDFKALVRERMARTGERYSAARARLLSSHTPSSRSTPGILNGYDRFGGVQPGTAAVCNALHHARIHWPLSKTECTEVLVNGLCGGPGFLYAVFEYKGWPPILSLALQSRSMPDVYIGEGLARLGIRRTPYETTSRAAARKALDDALARDRAAICVVDVASLPWHGLPREFVGGGPHVVTVAGRDGESYWIDDRALRPIRVDATVLADSRAAYRKGKNRLTTIDGPDASADPRRAMSDAIADTARRYVDPAVPKSFQVNCGFSGLAKWKQLLTDRRDRKGWPSIFAEGARAFAGLQRAYEAIECQVAPGAGRGFYAQWLDDAAATLGRPALSDAAAAYRESAAAWSALAGVIAKAPDRALRDACLLADRRLELADAQTGGSADAASLVERRKALADECHLSTDDALSLYAEMATLVGRVIDAEQAAVKALGG
jgi:hypothetical protein